MSYHVTTMYRGTMSMAWILDVNHAKKKKTALRIIKKKSRNQFVFHDSGGKAEPCRLHWKGIRIPASHEGNRSLRAEKLWL